MCIDYGQAAFLYRNNVSDRVSVGTTLSNHHCRQMCQQNPLDSNVVNIP